MRAPLTLRRARVLVAAALLTLPAVAVTGAVTTAALGAAVLAAAPAAASPAPAHAAPPVAPVAPVATPQGPLPASGCTAGTGTATCDLYAKPGSAVIASQSVPIWGLASTAAAPATTPGPVLTVTEGDQVALTIHNGLATPLSLAVSGMTGLADDTTGAAPGATATYTFRAGRPGTFLYEAGHTPDGARQTTMGIFGALVVRSATGGTAYGTADTAFQDEAVLVLSEIDPAFNADPAGFDMRAFKAKYRLINGKAYPETDPVATGPGRKVLLRYVNAGQSMHAMGVLGAHQILVAGDARPGEVPTQVVASQIDAGATADALVTVPGPEDGAKFAVYETAGRLDTAGHLAGTSKVVAFGGMMSFLDTGASPSTGDTVGPVTQRLTVSPASATALQTVTVQADLTDAPNGNSAVTAAEYVIDDPTIAVGSGTPLSGVYGTPSVTGAFAGIALASVTPALSTGKHMVYVRARDAQGNWGVVNSVVLTVSSSGPATSAGSLTPSSTNGLGTVALATTGDDTLLGGTVDRAEYFLGAAGDPGTGAAMALTSGTIAAETATIPSAALASQPEGPVQVQVRSHDSFGLWGPVLTLTLGLDRTAPALVSGAVTPTPNNGTNGSTADPTAIQVSGAFTDPVAGGLASPIAAAEGFLDNPAGVAGTGFTFVAADGTFNATSENAYGLIPLSTLTGVADGTHSVFVHAKDAAGNWGPLVPLTLVVDRGGPVLTAATVTPATVVRTTTSLALSATATDALTAVTAAEWFEGTDPGKGAGHAMTVTATGPRTATVATSASPGGLSVGQHTLSLRAKDSAGNWGAVATVRVTVSALSNTVLTDGFESGGFGAWAGQTGLVAVTTDSALTGTKGMQATGNGAAPAYVVDTNPLNDAAYHLQFQFRPDTLATAGGTVNITTGRSTAGQTLFSVQYRTSGTTKQVRMGVLRNNGTTSFTAWVTVGAGTQTIRIDWAAGTSATEKITVGAAVQQLTGVNTGTARLDTVWFGLSAGAAATTGAASFDAVTATRFTLP